MMNIRGDVMFFLFFMLPIIAWIVNVFYIRYKLSLIIPYSIIVAIVLMLPALRMRSLYTMFIYHFIMISWMIDILNLMIKNSLWHTLYKYSIIPFLLACLVIGYGLYNMKDIKRHVFNVRTSLSHDYKIALISDMHYGISLNKDELHQVIKRINHEKALLLLGGDIFDENTTRKQAQDAIEELGLIQTTYGSYYVFGNHDKQLYTEERAYQVNDLMQWMEDKNIHVLEDQIVSINKEIDLIGRKDKSDLTRKNIKLLSLNKDKYNIVLDHQPVEYAQNKKAGVSLNLSGHTHAGQIFPIGFINRFLPTTGQYIGYQHKGSFDAIVTSGIAGWGYPIRTEGHSEYAVIQLKNLSNREVKHLILL